MAKFALLKPPRNFKPNTASDIELKEVAKINLDANEQVCFITSAGNQYDVVRKEWGYYATPSINKRLLDNGFETFLVKNRIGNLFVLLVLKEKITLFTEYCNNEKLSIVVKISENTLY